MSKKNIWVLLRWLRSSYELRPEYYGRRLRSARRSVNAPRLQIILINGLTMLRERYNSALFIIVRANGTLLLNYWKYRLVGSHDIQRVCSGLLLERFKWMYSATVAEIL